MRSVLLLGCVLFSFGAYAATVEDCPALLEQAEKEEITDVNPYDFCGFGDENLVWSKWAPHASQHQLKKALYEICIRYPNHVYHDIYCEKSAQFGYGPALALKAESLLEKGESETGLKWATQAIETKELSVEQTGHLLETIGLYYLKNDNPKYRTYFEQAALRRSALANHILSVIIYGESEQSEADEKMAFQLIWRAILLGCPNAQENLGLFHLVRQKKIPFETAFRIMQDKMYSCDAVPTEEKKVDSTDESFYECRCKTAIENEKRFREKPYLLMRINGEQAVLKDASGQEYQVSVKDNLPEQGTVAEIRKSAVILTYPNDRVILNLYKPDKCAAFCEKNQIEENLTPEEMQKRLMGDVGIRIQPYRLTFTPEECETLLYYAPELVDTSLPFVGKEECMKKENLTADDTILNQILSAEKADSSNTSSSTESTVEQQKQGITEQTKQRLKQFDASFID